MGIFSKLPIFGDEAVAKGTRKAMMGSYNKVKNGNPGFSESDYLKTALSRRFRNWSDFELEAFVFDCNTIDDLIEKIIFQEKNRII
ncbi:MAG: hypothetical protein HN601_13405 [Candidatus Marinimicrobia bacterium]|jgi:hypothetical protein|nr:hypothetical protein [Candidatus Neomarinimicrobiota bacterium]